MYNTENQNKDRMPDRAKLVVCAKEAHIEEHQNPGPTGTWDVMPCGSLQEIVEHVSAERVDAVALRFNPLDQNARMRFIKLAEIQKNGRPFIVSYSSFNPDWIENLVLGSGANIHIRGNLDLNKICNVLDEYVQNESAHA